jgi:hypothetical protein
MPCQNVPAGAALFGSAVQSNRRFWVKAVLPRLVTATLLFGLCAGGQAQDDAREVLLRVKQAVMSTVQGLPKYVCTETIDRTRFDPDPSRYVLGDSQRHVHSCDSLAAEANSAGWKRQMSSSDRVRLDVAVTHRRPGLDSEMYSWAGEDHFSDGDLFEMVRDGAISTGSFSSMLASIFGGEAANFSYNGDRTSLGGRLLSEFGFRVPLEKSRYSYVLGSKEAREVTIEYGGTLLADPATSDLVRLVIRASHLPAESSTCQITQVLDYSRVSLNGADFLLPAEARIAALHSDGSQAENVIHYSACHEFRGESAVRFETLPEVVPGRVKDPTSAALSLPAGLRFKLVFTERINTSEAAAGDPIRAKLKTEVRDRSSKVLIPEGAAVMGRIVSIRHFYRPVRSPASEDRGARVARPSLVMKVRLETVEVGGVFYPLKARYDASLSRFPKVGGVLAPRIEMGDLGTIEDSENADFEFFDSDPSQIVTSGLESNWLTLAP